MLFQFGLALLALSSLTTASDPGCEELLKPLEDRSRISGKWIFYVGTSDNEDFRKELKTIKSSWMEITPIPDSDDMNLHWGDKMSGKCYYIDVNSTFSGNSTKVTFYFNTSEHEHVGKHLTTCPDCILWTDNSVSVTNGETKKGRNLYLFTKSGKLDPFDLEVFKKQASCLNFPSEFHFGHSTDLCPDEKEPSTDVKEDKH
ncbi:uncharacterized protein LOC115425317 [Sphaeramia orbicularis]|uniref:Uncharacterized LOC115425317 n=1 Tax=Sphaeramia orbicularis TaxID=375764 RepID=A0A673CGN0_9TELE|nr:uncharacterized protein LOC115425317 [Sphaeramia orbicularis]